MSAKQCVIFLLLLQVLFCAFGTGWCASGNYDTFAVIGDTHVGKAPSLYETFINRMEKEGIQAVMHVGDAIAKPGDLAEWDHLFGITGNAITLHIAPGNHDVNNRRSLAVYTKATGRGPYHSVASTDTLFVFLNTELPGQEARITGRQLAWLETELRRDFKYRFVFLHRPLFPTIFGTGYCLDRYPAERDRLHQLFVRHGVTLVMSGHQHLYNRSEKDGILYVITGGGGAPLHPFTGDLSGFMHYIVAKKRNEGYVFSAFDFKGTVRDEFSLRR
jgi:3',5'-cyclic AMP phosphodiesterase CpdA